MIFFKHIHDDFYECWMGVLRELGLVCNYLMTEFDEILGGKGKTEKGHLIGSHS